MALPKIFAAEKKDKQLLLAIILNDVNTQAILWNLSPSGVEVIKQSKVQSYFDDHDAVMKTDQALQELGKKSESVDQVIFGLDPSWTTEKDVAANKEPILQKLTEELDLEAQGFVVITESVTQFLVKEDPRLSSLLILINQKTLSLNLILQGKLTAQQQVGRSDKVLADVIEALARLNAHQAQPVSLPPKFLLASTELSAEELEDHRQSLLDQDWVNSHPFSQAPIVDILPTKKVIEAILTQAGLAISKSKPNEENSELNDTKAKSFGVPITNDQLPQETDKDELAVMPSSSIQFDHPKTEKSAKTKSSKKNKLLSMPIFSWFAHHKKFVIAGFVAGLVALFLGGYIWAKTTAKIVINLDLKSQPLSQETSLTLDSNLSQSDPDKLILAAKELSAEVSDSATAATSGIKLVGEKAGGKINIFNKTDNEKTFDAGTVLSAGVLGFTLDESVTIASSSVKKEATSENKEYGQTEASVTAQAIGSDSNLAKDELLTIESFSSDTYSATVTEGLSGGVSREVRVASEQDRKDLLASLKESLLEKGNEQLKSSLEQDQYLVPAGEITVTDSQYSAEAGDEAGSLDLLLTATVVANSYQAQDLRPIAEVLLADEIPEGYRLSDKDPQILSAPQQASSSTKTVIEVNISSQAVPDLSVDDLKNSLVGLPIKQVASYVAERDGIEGMEIVFNPPWVAKLFSKLPKDSAKIELVLD